MLPHWKHLTLEQRVEIAHGPFSGLETRVGAFRARIPFFPSGSRGRFLL